MTQELYQKALKFAGEKHKDQKVPGTEANYILHISNVAMEVILSHSFNNCFNLDYAVQVAILHDTIEDTETDYSEIDNNFEKKIATAVQALSKNRRLPTKAEQMIDSLDRINKLDKEVAIVKIADRITNLQAPPSYWNRAKKIRYQTEAKLIANSLKNNNEYLYKRLKTKISEYDKYL